MNDNLEIYIMMAGTNLATIAAAVCIYMDIKRQRDEREAREQPDPHQGQRNFWGRYRR